MARTSPHPHLDPPAGTSRRWLLAVFLLFTTTIAAIGSLVFQGLSEALSQRETERLTAVADLKARQIGDWLEEYRRDVQGVADNPLFKDALRRWHDSGMVGSSGEILAAALAAVATQEGFSSVALLGADGSRLLATGEVVHDHEGSPQHAAAVRAALDTGRAALVDFHRDRDDGDTALAYLVPTFGGAAHAPPLALLSFTIDPRHELYPLLRTWPGSSASGETLLVRRDEQEVVFLSELRHRSDAPLRLRLTIERSDLPAAHALLRGDGPFAGRDYRDVAVLSVSRHIEGTPWQLIAKVDRDEAERDVRRLAVVSALAVLLAIAGSGALLGLLWQRQRVAELQFRARQAQTIATLSERYRALVEGAAEGFFAFDLDGRFVEVNQRACSSTGYTREELLHMGMTDLDPHLDLTRAQETWRNLVPGAGLTQLGFQRHKNGTLIPVEVRLSAFRFKERRLLLALVHDVTERLREKQALRDSENLLRLITDAEPALISYVGSDYRYRLVNRTYERWFGRAPEAMQGQCVRDVLGESAWQKVRPYMERALAGEAVTYEDRLPYRDGGSRWVEVAYTPDRDGYGRVHGFVVLVQDISERKRIEGELVAARAEAERTAARLQLVFERMTDALVVTDAAGTLTYHNPAALAVHGYASAEEAHLGVGQLLAMWALYDLDGRALPFEQWPLGRVLRGERFAGYEVRVRRSDGSREFIGSYGGTPVFGDDGALQLAIITLRDVTATKRVKTALRHKTEQLLRRNEELLRANAELEEFAYVASHDLKAPLRAVANLALVIDEDGAGLDPDSRRHLAELRERVMRMDALIDGLLAYARIDPSKTGKSQVAVAEIVADLLAESPPPDGFVIETDPSLPTLEAAPEHVRQMVQHLLTNAVVHHDQPRGHIRIAARESATHWHLEVADDGPGIPVRARPHVFRMFTTGGRGRHIGLGLAIVRKLAACYGASVSVDDNPPRGTVVRIAWPKVRPRAGAETPAQESEGDILSPGEA